MKKWLLWIALTSSSVYALPTMDDVDHSIAAQNLPLAKAQVQEVLKQDPMSYNANRYMVEILQIQSDVDGAKDPLITYYQNKVDTIESQRRTNNFVHFITGVVFLIACGMAGYCAVMYVRRRRKQKAAQLEFEHDRKLLVHDVQELKTKIQQMLTLGRFDLVTTQLQEANSELSEMLSVLLDHSLAPKDVALAEIKHNFFITRDYVIRVDRIYG